MTKPTTAVLPLGAVPSVESPSAPECDDASPRHLWLAIVFPQLAVDAVVTASTETPLAVMDEVGGRQFIHTATATARQRGVVAGMTVSAACALCPALQVIARDPHAEQRLLTALAQRAGRFTSWVSVQSPNALLLEVRGSLHLFGGLDALRNHIEQELSDDPRRFMIAVAPTPQAAVLLSTQGDAIAVTQPQALRSILGKYPVSCLPLEKRTLLRLDKTGLRTLRDLWRLPRDDLARRFGAELVDYLDRLLGRRNEPRQAYAAPHRYAANVELSLETSDTALILNAIDQLLQRLCDFLRVRDAGVNRLQLWLYHLRHPATRLTLGARRINRNSGDWRKLFDERLNQTQLAASVISLRLVADEVHAYTPGRRALFTRNERDAMDEDWHMLLDQLQARLGRDAIHGLQAMADHRPERAWRYSSPGASQPLFSPPATRPLWLLRQPRLLPHVGNLCLQPDVERIEGGWWSGVDSRRDYYRARDRRGRCLWLFRDLRDEGRWCLHGLYG